MAQDLKRRKFERGNALNLVDYIVLAEDGSQLTRGMGRTRNVSEGGLSLETHRPLQDGQIVLITIGLKDDMLQLRGRVVHQEAPAAISEETRYCAGIQFTSLNEKGLQTLQNYIKLLKSLNRT
ncbi:MAG: PilZ domain-containing protein [Deltaproteobacteria bacterium]|nr:PilZ domain-containing protein [Deltaproteobacteria bacterium]